MYKLKKKVFKIAKKFSTLYVDFEALEMKNATRIN